MKSSCLHSDATNIRINGEKWNIYVTANDTNVIYTLSKVKGIEGIKATPLKNYLNAVIHDHDKSYYNEEFAFSNHQECLAHILRYLQDSVIIFRCTLYGLTEVNSACFKYRPKNAILAWRFLDITLVYIN